MQKKHQSWHSREQVKYQFPFTNKILMTYLIILVVILLATYSYLRTVFLMFYAVIVFMNVLIVAIALIERFKIESDGIKFYKFFRCSKVLYKDVSSIVISHAWHEGKSAGFLGRYKKSVNGKIRFRPYPWITCCDRIPDKVMSDFSDTLRGTDVDYFLKKNGLLYSFIWNRCAMENLLMHHEVNLFITRSISVRYKAEIEEMAAKYKVPNERIHIIKDKVAMEWFWDNDFESRTKDTL